MSPIVYLERKEDHNTKTKQKCQPLFYLKKKDNNNTKTKQKFYVTHCFI